MNPYTQANVHGAKKENPQSLTSQNNWLHHSFHAGHIILYYCIYLPKKGLKELPQWNRHNVSTDSYSYMQHQYCVKATSCAANTHRVKRLVPVKQVTSHKDFCEIPTSLLQRHILFIFYVFSPCPLQMTLWDSQEAWKSEQAVTLSYQNSLWMASSLPAPRSVKTREINGQRFHFKQLALINHSSDGGRWIKRVPFAHWVTWDAVVSLALLKWGGWDIPSTREKQTAPWGVTGCPPCSFQRSTASPLQWSGQSLHCGQTLQRRRNSKISV